MKIFNNIKSKLSLSYIQSKLSVFMSQPFIMFVIMVLTVYFSGYKKSDNMQDFQNYHYYNAFAFLNNTGDRFLVPGGVNSFFNPIADIPLYLLIQYFNDNPTLIYAIQGIWGGCYDRS